MVQVSQGVHSISECTLTALGYRRGVQSCKPETKLQQVINLSFFGGQQSIKMWIGLITSIITNNTFLNYTQDVVKGTAEQLG